MYLRKYTAEDFDILRELSIRTYYETFAHLNTKEDMDAYLEDAFNVERLKTVSYTHLTLPTMAVV